MIEIGSGLAAVIGAGVGGAASFAGTWLSSHFELKKVQDAFKNDTLAEYVKNAPEAHL